MISIRRNSGYAGLLGGVRLAASVATIPVLTRVLGISEYGVWAVLMSMLALSPVFQLGLAASLSYYIAEDTDTAPESVRAALLLFFSLGCIICASLLVAAPLIASWLFNGTNSLSTVVPIRVLGFAALTQFLRQWAISVEAGLQRYDLQARAEGCGLLVTNIGLIGLALWGFGVLGLTAWVTVTSFLTFILHCMLLKSLPPLNFSGAIPRRHANLLLRYGWRHWVSQACSTVFAQADRLVVGVALGTAAAGLYAAATSVASRIGELSAAPLQVIVPAIAEMKGNKNYDRIRRVFLQAQDLNLLLGCALSVSIILLAHPLSVILVPGNSASEVESMLPPVALAYGLFSINAAGYFAALGIGRPAINAKWGVLSGAVFFTALGAAVWGGSLQAAAWANLGYATALGINLEVAGLIGVPKALILRRYLKHAGGVAFFAVIGFHLMTRPDSAVERNIYTCSSIILLLVWLGFLTMNLDVSRVWTARGMAWWRGSRREWG